MVISMKILCKISRIIKLKGVALKMSARRDAKWKMKEYDMTITFKALLEPLMELGNFIEWENMKANIATSSQSASHN